MSEKKKILIAGCGFLGKKLVELFSREGWEVTALVRHAENCHFLKQSLSLAKENSISQNGSVPLSQEAPRIFSTDITQAGRLGALALQLPEFDAVVHCASSRGEQGYEWVYLRGVENLRQVFAPKCFVFCSSTSVYSQTGGEEVDESSKTIPYTENSRLLQKSEQSTEENPLHYIVRLGALYGVGRFYMLKKFLEKKAVLEKIHHLPTGRYLNHIHLEDAAHGIFHLVNKKPASGCYNLVDDAPQSQHAIYQWLSQHFQQPMPDTAPPNFQKTRGWTNKRVLNTKLRSTGWAPLFPNLRYAIEKQEKLVQSLGVDSFS